MKENLINVQMSEEFYNEKFLKMGGGTESGSNIKYLNVQKLHETGMFDTVIAMMPGLLAVKAVGSDFTSIVPLSYLYKSYYN